MGKKRKSLTKETQEENDTFDTDLSNNDSDSEGDI